MVHPEMKKSDILETYAPLMENLLLILHDFQNNNPRNYLSEKDLGLIAKYLNTPYSSIFGVASYYTMFSLKPRGKHVIRICQSPVCHMAGLSDIFTELQHILKINSGETTPDGQFTLETSECLGQCDEAPVMAVNEALYGDLCAKNIMAIIWKYKKKRSRARKQIK